MWNIWQKNLLLFKMTITVSFLFWEGYQLVVTLSLSIIGSFTGACLTRTMKKGLIEILRTKDRPGNLLCGHWKMFLIDRFRSFDEKKARQVFWGTSSAKYADLFRCSRIFLADLFPYFLSSYHFNMPVPNEHGRASAVLFIFLVFLGGYLS